MSSGTKIAETARVEASTVFQGDAVVEDFVIIQSHAQNPTVVGDDAIIRSGTVIYAGNTIGAGFRTGNKANIRENNRIGANVSVGTLSVIEHHVDIGDNVRIHTQVFVPEYSRIEDNVWIGPNVVLTNARYPASASAKENLVGCILRSGCKIGANATLLPGVEIGENALVGAGAVVTHSVAPGTVVAGNPAREINRVSGIEDYNI